MKINLDINLSFVNEDEWEVVDYRIPQIEEWFYDNTCPCVQFCAIGAIKTAHFILRKIERPEETNAIWHPIEKLKELDPRFDYDLIVKAKGLSIQTFNFVPRECKNFQYLNYRLTEFAIIRKQVR